MEENAGQYEYKFVTAEGSDAAKQMRYDAEMQHGWEWVAMTTDGRAIFKRRKDYRMEGEGRYSE